MHYIFVLSMLSIAACVSVQYTDKYDTIDLEQLLGNKRLLVAYIKCILDQGKCSKDGLELKSHIKEALESRCAKCTVVQQLGVRRVFSHLINNEPEYWQQIVAKYDPEHKYIAIYEKELKYRR